MHAIEAEQHPLHSLPHHPGGAQANPASPAAGSQWKQPWWSAWMAPMPNWLERLERGAPLPRMQRR